MKTKKCEKCEATWNLETREDCPLCSYEGIEAEIKGQIKVENIKKRCIICDQPIPGTLESYEFRGNFCNNCG